MKIVIMEDENRISKTVLEFSDIVGYRQSEDKVFILKNRTYGITGPVKVFMVQDWFSDALQRVMAQ